MELLIRSIKIEGGLSMVAYAVALLCVELVLFSLINLALFKVEFPERSLLVGGNLSSAPGYLILKNALLIYMLRLVFYSTFFIGAIAVLKRIGMADATWALALSNLLVYVAISGALALVFPFTREYFVFDRPYYQNAFFYVCSLVCIVAPFALQFALRLVGKSG